MIREIAKVFVTDRVPDGCAGNYTKAPADARPAGIEELLRYDGIVLAGGEPMLLADRMVELVHQLRAKGFDGSISIETSYIDPAKRKKWADRRLFLETDEIAFIIRPGYGHGNLAALRKLSRYLSASRDNDSAEGHAVCRLFVDGSAGRDVNWEAIAMNGWASMDLEGGMEALEEWEAPEGTLLQTFLYNLANS